MGTEAVLDIYEQYLKSCDGVEDYRRRFIPIVYWDDDGEEKIYHIDYYVRWRDGTVEWIQCIPHGDLRPIKKYLYAKRISESHDIVFRGLNSKELFYIESLFPDDKINGHKHE